MMSRGAPLAPSFVRHTGVFIFISTCLRSGDRAPLCGSHPDNTLPCWPHSKSPQNPSRFTISGMQTTDQVDTPGPSHMTI